MEGATKGRILSVTRSVLPWIPALLWVVIAFHWTHGFRAFTTFSAAATAPGELPRPAPRLSFVDHRGRHASLGGRWTLVSFFYLRCPGVCHMALGKKREVVSLLAEENDDLAFVSLSFDDDPPDQVASLREALSAPQSWRFGVLDGGPRFGDDPQLEQIGALVVRRPDGGYNHSTYLYLIDPAQRLVKVVPPDDPARAAREIRLAMR